MRIGFDLSINNFDLELYVRDKRVMEQREGESSDHILLKILALCLYYDERMEIEPTDLDHQYQPDLAIRSDIGGPTLWIECGNVRTVKLDKLTSRYGDAKIVVVKASQREVDDIYTRVLKDLRRPYNLEYVGFDPHFVERAAAQVTGKNKLTTLINGNEIQVILNNGDYKSEVYRRFHEGPKYRGKSYA